MKNLLSVALIACLFAPVAHAAGHDFWIGGTAVGGDSAGTHLILETGTGPGVSRYTVVCGSNVSDTCGSIALRVALGDSPVVSTSGAIVKQVASDALTQSVRFRATSVTVKSSPTALPAGSVSGACLKHLGRLFLSLDDPH